MTVPVHGKIRRWIIDPVFANTTAGRRLSSSGRMRAEWKLFAVVAVTALLTWREWVEHHPPEIALIALIHLVFVWVGVAIIVHVVQWLSRKNPG
jgi:hypothetical protein